MSQARLALGLGCEQKVQKFRKSHFQCSDGGLICESQLTIPRRQAVNLCMEYVFLIGKLVGHGNLILAVFF